MTLYGAERGEVFAAGQAKANKKIVGPSSSAIKYDILTALLAMAAGSDDAATSRLALRLSLVITARFNWRLGTFNVGQRELAKMWNVTERTAKREIAFLRTRGWISVERPAARGRVARHRIEFSAVLHSTSPHWENVGPDFLERMAGTPEPSSDNVVPLKAVSVTVPAQDGSIWPEVAAALQNQDHAAYAAWFADLTFVEADREVCVLAAPTQFAANYIKTHLYTRLFAAVVSRNRSIRRVELISA